MLIRSSLVVLVMASLAACDKVPLGAPTSSTITVNSSTRSIPVGGSTEISAFVSEGTGTLVQNGTTVRFTTNLGTLEPVDAQTSNGVATTTLRAGTTSGVAQVRATSGNATVGAGNVIDINIGAASASAITVSASSQTVPSAGGTVSVIAVVVDAQGNRVAGAPVSFTTTAGTLSSASVPTNGSGEATVQLTTDRTATVNARAGTANGSVVITAQSTTLALAVLPVAPVAGQVVTLTVTPTIAAGSASPRVSVNWGDGTIEDLGLVTAARPVTHIVASAGTFTIVATATSGTDVTTASINLIVAPRPAIGVNVTVTPAPAIGTTSTFTATITGDTSASIRSYRWVFTGGTFTGPADFETNGTTTTKTFTASGATTVTVTATTTDGREGTGLMSFNIP